MPCLANNGQYGYGHILFQPKVLMRGGCNYAHEAHSVAESTGEIMTQPTPFDLEELIKYARHWGSYYGIGPYIDHDPQTKAQRDKWREIARALMAYDVLLKRAALTAQAVPWRRESLPTSDGGKMIVVLIRGRKNDIPTLMTLYFHNGKYGSSWTISRTGVGISGPLKNLIIGWMWLDEFKPYAAIAAVKDGAG